MSKVLIGRSLALRLLASCLRPVAYFCLRHGLRLPDIIECAKGELVRAARRELERQGLKPSTSRISVATGVHRADVDRVSIGGTIASSSQDLVTRVMGQWQSDRAFLSRAGKPRVLSVGDENAEFSKLVRAVSRDPNPGTVLAELRRLELVEDTRGGVALRAASNVAADDPEKGFALLADDVRDLTSAVEANVLAKPTIPHFHARTEFDNVRPEALPKLRQFLIREGHRFHAEMRRVIGAEDRDINPIDDDAGGRARVVVGAFSFIEEEPIPDGGKEKK